jgi:hypothetical protein
MAAFEVQSGSTKIGSFDGIAEYRAPGWGAPSVVKNHELRRRIHCRIRRGPAPSGRSGQSKSWRNCWPPSRARGGRLFILGVGGSAANASHAVNDFRKICGMEAYCPTDNVSELTARTNDEGWATVFEAWLRVSRLRAEDCVLVFSVGGGNLEKQVSPNLVSALQYAKSVGAAIGGVVGRRMATPRKWRTPA